VLTGQIFCGWYNGMMTNIGRDYLACSWMHSEPG
jgi:hypothetical protein